MSAGITMLKQWYLRVSEWKPDWDLKVNSLFSYLWDKKNLFGLWCLFLGMFIFNHTTFECVSASLKYEHGGQRRLPWGWCSSYCLPVVNPLVLNVSMYKQKKIFWTSKFTLTLMLFHLKGALLAWQVWLSVRQSSFSTCLALETAYSWKKKQHKANFDVIFSSQAVAPVCNKWKFYVHLK